MELLRPTNCFNKRLAGFARAQALSSRPDLRRSVAIEAANRAKKGAVYGPIIPTVGAQVFAAAWAAADGAPGRFGESEEYILH